MEIGKKINQLRKLSGMTQEQLAEKLNVSRQTISKWEAGTTLPDLESVVKLSRIFHNTLYRYMVVNEYVYAPVNYPELLLPSLGTGIIGLLLCLYYVWENRNGGKKLEKKN